MSASFYDTECWGLTQYFFRAWSPNRWIRQEDSLIWFTLSCYASDNEDGCFQSQNTLISDTWPTDETIRRQIKQILRCEWLWHHDISDGSTKGDLAPDIVKIVIHDETFPDLIDVDEFPVSVTETCLWQEYEWESECRQWWISSIWEMLLIRYLVKSPESTLESMFVDKSVNASGWMNSSERILSVVGVYGRNNGQPRRCRKQDELWAVYLMNKHTKVPFLFTSFHLYFFTRFVNEMMEMFSWSWIPPPQSKQLDQQASCSRFSPRMDESTECRHQALFKLFPLCNPWFQRFEFQRYSGGMPEYSVLSSPCAVVAKHMSTGKWSILHPEINRFWPSGLNRTNNGSMLSGCVISDLWGLLGYEDIRYVFDLGRIDRLMSTIDINQSIRFSAGG
jgi:hypothetical protein